MLQITGGEFANGAMTTAFVHLFNAEAGLTRQGIEFSVGEKLNTTISKNMSMDVSLGTASISYDENGELTTTLGILSTKAQLDDFKASITSMGIDLRGMTVELNNFSKETVSWKIYKSYEIFRVFDLGAYMPSYSGSFDVNLLGYVYRNNGLMGNEARLDGISNSDRCQSEL